MSPLPHLPKRLKLPPSPVIPLREIVREGRQQVERARDEVRSIADELRGTTPEALEGIKTTLTPVAEGTACLPCSRDHLSTTSSSLSEGIRFARDGGIRHPEVVRRIRIALDELNIMERIDLAPEETAKLKGPEKELANWALRNSRELRHSISAIRDVETMEQAVAKASQAAEEFIKRLWELPGRKDEECLECEGLQDLKSFLEKRRRKQ